MNTLWGVNRADTFWVSWSRRFALLIGLAVVGLLIPASEARAGCMTPSQAQSAPIAFFTGQATATTNHQDDDYRRQPATIVGLWHVIYTATYSTAGPFPVPVIPPGPPDSFLFAETMKTWHADGTEWEEKIAPPPVGFCYGVWKHAANGSVKLHHFGAVPAPDGSVVAIFYIDEINRVMPDGKTYIGVWDMKIYGATDVFGTGPVLQQIKGTTAATRISVD